MRSPKTIALAAGLTVWIGCVVAGFAGLQNYASTPGSARSPDDDAQTFLERYRQPKHGLVVMAVHPLCPCTDASLDELGDLLARSQGACDAVILEFRPAMPPADWPTRASVQHLGGVTVPVLLDEGGKMAAQLGAQTSGHAVFVDAAGVIRFHGGITLARGHRGRSPAQDAILAALQGAEMPLSAAPVFGCALEPECKAELNP
jgi:hypothetical protein